MKTKPEKTMRNGRGTGLAKTKVRPGATNPFDFTVAESAAPYNAKHPPRPKSQGDASEVFFFRPAAGVKLIKGDCVEVMRSAPDECVDLIFADPPYFLSNNGVTCHAGRMVSVNKGKWDASKGTVGDHEFVKAWLIECKRLLKPHGTIWVSGTLHNIFSVGYGMQELGFKILNDIIWQKPNPPPHLACRYFAHSTETILWARKSEKAKHYFNYKLMKKANAGRQMKNVWTMRAPDKHEKRYGKHPTQKPVALLERIILAASRPGDLVLDPFNGSGTTGVAAVKHGRRYVGIELEQEFLVVSQKRIEDVLSREPLFDNLRHREQAGTLRHA